MILVAPQAFKGSFSAVRVAELMAQGARQVAGDLPVVLLPISDGGDGLLESLPLTASREVQVRGPLGTPVYATVGQLGPNCAVIESAQACGLKLVSIARRDPERMSTYGLGELILAASEGEVEHLVVGLGGSASVDGGVGMAAALGFRLLDEDGGELPANGAALQGLASVVGHCPTLPTITALVDVDSPLLGPTGAARVFGPQKGADASMVERLETGLARLDRVMAHPGVAEQAGAGAAGGLGAGMIMFCGASLAPGAPWVLEQLGFDSLLSQASAVLTAEGRWDRTSRMGKGTGEVARRAAAASVSWAVVAGTTDHASPQVFAGAGEHLEAEDIVALARAATSSLLP